LYAWIHIGLERYLLEVVHIFRRSSFFRWLCRRTTAAPPHTFAVRICCEDERFGRSLLGLDGCEWLRCHCHSEGDEQWPVVHRNVVLFQIVILWSSFPSHFLKTLTDSIHQTLSMILHSFLLTAKKNYTMNKILYYTLHH